MNKNKLYLFFNMLGLLCIMVVLSLPMMGVVWAFGKIVGWW